jgi:hypothetical protein
MEEIRNMPKDLKEAVDFLKSFEKSNDHSKRTQHFEDAIENLNSHLEANSDTSHKVFIKNLKLTYTRILLEQLPSLSTLDIEDWARYLRLLMQTAPNETEALTKEHSHLRVNKEAFITIWIDEMIAMLKKMSNQHKNATNFSTR